MGKTITTFIICLILLILFYVTNIHPALTCDDTLVRGVWRLECIEVGQ